MRPVFAGGQIIAQVPVQGAEAVRGEGAFSHTGLPVQPKGEEEEEEEEEDEQRRKLQEAERMKQRAKDVLHSITLYYIYIRLYYILLHYITSKATFAQT